MTGAVPVLAVVATGTTPLSGTLIFLGLVIACIGLFFAMNRSLRKVPKSFGPPSQARGPRSGPEPDGSGVGGVLESGGAVPPAASSLEPFPAEPAVSPPPSFEPGERGTGSAGLADPTGPDRS